MSEAKQNEDVELWREADSFYANSIHRTKDGGIGIDVGGTVFVKTLAEWHRLAAWEARGRASGQQGVEGHKLVVVDPEDRVWEDAAFNLSSRFGPEFVEGLGEFAKVLCWLEMMTLAASPQITSPDIGPQAPQAGKSTTQQE